MFLSDKNVIFQAIPAASPIFVRPADTERKIDILIVKIIVERFFKQTFTVEPIIIKSKTMDTIFASQLHLAFFHLRQAQIIKSEFARQMRLVMPRKLRNCFRTVAPLGKPTPPPVIILNDRMELRQIKGNQFNERLLR